MSEAREKIMGSLKLAAAWDLSKNIIAGRQVHDSHRVTSRVTDYLDEFGHLLTERVKGFLEDHLRELDELLGHFEGSETHSSIVDCGLLAATRFYDTYLLKSDSGVFESVSHFYTRMAAFCAVESYNSDYLTRTLSSVVPDLSDDLTVMSIFGYYFRLLTSQLVVPATPIMRGAGLARANLASCFIMSPDLKSDDAVSYYVMENLSQTLLRKSGVGLNLTSFRVKEKSVESLCKVVNSQIEFFNDASVRPVSVAGFMEIWHHQIFTFLKLKSPENPDRCGSLFQGVCIPSLFFKIYETGDDPLWFLFDPEDVPTLAGLYGKEFEEEYWRYVYAGVWKQAVSIKSLLFQLLSTVIKTGSPYIILKEACNEHHWKETRGNAINCANLCAEVIQQSSPDTTAICNLANVNLKKCLVPRTDSQGNEGREFDFEKLREATQGAVFIVNCAILGSFYFLLSLRQGKSDRSMGIGVQGLADVFSLSGWEYTAPESEKLDVQIFETMYYYAVKTSSEIVRVGRAPAFRGYQVSKFAKGVFHWEGWPNAVPDRIPAQMWEELRRQVSSYGTFNSQFIALMPTAGSSQITGSSESFAPYFANVSSKVTNKQEVMNPSFVFLGALDPEDLPEVKSVGGDVSRLSPRLRTKYARFLSAFDYEPEELMRRAAKRAPFVDQSQSFSLFLREENVRGAKYLKDLIFLGYRLGLKTIMYYCRIKKIANMSELECRNVNSRSLGVSSGPIKCAGTEDASSGGENPNDRCLCCQ